MGLRLEQAKVFLLTFFSYAAYHVSRKCLSVIKHDLTKAEWFGPGAQTKAVLGDLDSSFLALYAVGLYVSGFIGDRCNLKYFLVGGMLSSASVASLFGVLGYFDVHAPWPYILVWATCGLLQSSGWPANVGIMGRWFTRQERGAVFGFWSGNASAGNIIGAGVVIAIFSIARGGDDAWKLAMLATSGVIVLEALAILLFLVEDPEIVGLHPQGKPQVEPLVSQQGDGATPGAGDDLLLVHSARSALPPDSPTAAPGDRSHDPDFDGGAAPHARELGVDEPIGFLRAWLIPGVVPYALCYACLKLVNYALFFWLPLALNDQYNISSTESDSLSTLYDVGQIAGSILAGFASDKLFGGRRAIVCVSMMLAAAAAIYALHAAPLSLAAPLCTLAGVLMGGPANLLSSAVAADLGTHPSLRGNKRSVATVAAILDGTGSVGAAIGQFGIGRTNTSVPGGWCGASPRVPDPLALTRCPPGAPAPVDRCEVGRGVVFLALAALDVVACLCLAHLFVRELRSLCRRKRDHILLPTDDDGSRGAGDGESPTPSRRLLPPPPRDSRRGAFPSVARRSSVRVPEQ